MRRAENDAALVTTHLHDGLKGRVIRGGVINLVSQAVSTVLQLGSSAILARLVAPADYGLLAMAGTAIALAAMLNNLGLTTPTIQRAEITSEQVSTLFYLSAAGGLVLYLATCLAAPLFAATFHDPRVVAVLLIMGLTVPVSAATAQFNAVLMRNMRWITIQGINIAGQAAGAIAGVALAWLAGWGVYALVAQGLVSAFLILLLSWVASPWKPELVFNLRSVKSEVLMGLDVLLFTIFNYAHRQADNLIVGNRWGAVELAFYARGYGLMTQISSMVTGPVTNALIPALSRLAGEPDRWRKVMLDAASVVAAGAGGLFAVMWAVRAPLISILFGPRWIEVTETFGYLLIAGLATTVCSPFSWAFVTLGRTRIQLYWSIFSSPILVVAFWIGGMGGGLGVAKAYAISMVLLNFIYVFVSLRATPVRFSEGVSLKVGVYCAFAAVVLAYGPISRVTDGLVPLGQLVMQACLAGLVYVVVMVALAFVIPAHGGVRALVRRGASIRSFRPRSGAA